jgi:hypothetical protein
MNLKTITASLVLLGQTAFPCKAGAACLDPKTFVSGYKEPIAEEVRTADAIVIGRVLSKQGLQEDPTDPDGYTAYKVKIEVITRLKGNLPKVFVIRDENTSARYGMSTGEEHLLFVSGSSEDLWVNSCGNSSVMPKGKLLVEQIQTQLRSLK